MTFSSSVKASRTMVSYSPVFKAFFDPLGGPVDLPPCKRHRFLPFIGGFLHGWPLRVFAPQIFRSWLIPPPQLVAFLTLKCVALHNDHEGDRKSTRLNSSHVKNSYDVFCL